MFQDVEQGKFDVVHLRCEGYNEPRTCRLRGFSLVTFAFKSITHCHPWCQSLPAAACVAKYRGSPWVDSVVSAMICEL